MPSTYTPIATTTLGSGSNSVTFSSLGSYTDLYLVIAAQGGGGGEGLYMRFNADTGSNYSWTRVYGTGSSVASDRGSNQTTMSIGVVDNVAISTSLTSIQNYSNSTTYKTAITRVNSTSNSVNAQVNMWRNTAAITSVTVLILSTNFATGSTFTLYGIQAF